MTAECSKLKSWRLCSWLRHYAKTASCLIVMLWVVMLWLVGCRTNSAPGETSPAAILDASLSAPAVANNAEDKNSVIAVNPGLVEIGQAELLKYRQVAAISDVHGHFLNAQHLLQKAGIVDVSGKWSGDKTLLVVIGDSIDKGPSSLPTLRCWLDLRAQADKAGGRVLVLLGNHEAEFLSDVGASGCHRT